MRNNQPVTQRGFEFADNLTLMSTTDTQSNITYANEAFVEVSGYERSEILGQPHNIVRHPDMPPEAFADMWATLRGGDSWTALVKNRRKDGDHYWVRANAAPVKRSDAIVGFISVRTKPKAEEVLAAEALYKRFRDGAAKGLAFHKGIVVRTGGLAWTSLLQTLPLRWRIRLIAMFSAVLTVGVASLAGLGMLGLGAVIVGALVSTFAVIAMLEYQIERPISVVLKQAQLVASGQPEMCSPLNRVDEIGLLHRAVNQSGLNLQALVDDVAARTHVVDKGSHEIATGNWDLSSRTESQAGALEEAAASMEEFSSTIQQNANHARQANDLAHKASLTAVNSSKVVAKVVDTMQRINDASKKISEIIGAIDGIAFQTNILALNAAVEAARAGEHGRGFAVVASEVRSLAGRSAEAAKEIRSLIANSVERVEQGSQLVDAAGSTMDEVVSSIQEVARLMTQITIASNEQASGVSQVNEAISLLDQTTQQNAALVEQSAAAADGLKNQAIELVSAVRVFKSKSESHGSLTKKVPGNAPTPWKCEKTEATEIKTSIRAKAKILSGPRSNTQEHALIRKNSVQSQRYNWESE